MHDKHDKYVVYNATFSKMNTNDNGRGNNVHDKVFIKAGESNIHGKSS